MMNKYKAEIDQIHADKQWKESLKYKMASKKEKQSILRYALVLAGCILFMFSYMQEKLSVLIIDESEKIVEFGGLGKVGNLGSDATLLAHNNPYDCDNNQGKLPVYENSNAFDESYLYKYDNEELLEILENTAKKLQLSNYTVKYLQEDPALMNSLVYLVTDIGKMDLLKRNMIQLRLDETIGWSIQGNTQQEKVENAKSFVENNRELFPFENIVIDVYLLTKEPFEKWRIRISEAGENQEETLVNNQLNYVEIFENDEGKIESFIYVNADLNNKVGDYPIKSIQDIKSQSDNDYQYIEMIYLPAGKYYLPYYKVTFMGTAGYFETKNICAIEDQYIQIQTAQ